VVSFPIQRLRILSLLLLCGLCVLLFGLHVLAPVQVHVHLLQEREHRLGAVRLREVGHMFVGGQQGEEVMLRSGRREQLQDIWPVSYSPQLVWPTAAHVSQQAIHLLQAGHSLGIDERAMAGEAVRRT
jgi:hypothetical protein